MLDIELDETTKPVNLERLCYMATDYAAQIGVYVEGPEVLTNHWHTQRQRLLKMAMKNCHDPFIVNQMIKEIRNKEERSRLDLRPYLN